MIKSAFKGIYSGRRKAGITPSSACLIVTHSGQGPRVQKGIRTGALMSCNGEKQKVSGACLMVLRPLPLKLLDMPGTLAMTAFSESLPPLGVR